MSSAEIPVYHFENVEVDTLRCRLKQRNEELHLRQQAFAVLVYLLENRDRVITKDELIDRIWNGTAVVDDALVQCIKDIRRALNDDPHRPKFIRTVPKRGYRFISPVAEDHNGTSTTNIEEIIQVELEIEEEEATDDEKISDTILASRLKNLIANPRASVTIPVAAVVVFTLAAGMIYFGSALLGAERTEKVRVLPITENAEALRYYSLGVEKAQAVHNKDAIEYFEKAIDLDPEFAMAYARIGYVYALTWAFPEKGKPYFEHALTFSNRLSEKDRLQIEAWSAIANQDYSAAITPLRELISRFPNESEAYWRLGRILSGEGRYEEAIAVLKQGLEVDPEAKNIYNFLGGLASVFGRHEEAVAFQQRYVELVPGEPNAFDSLGMALQHAGRYSEAAAQYQRALDLKPNFEVALAHFANTRFQQGRYREAIELFQKYADIAPSESEKARGYGRISIIYGRLRNYEKAGKAAHIASKYNNEDYSSLLLALERDDLSTARDLDDKLLTQSRYSSRGVRNDSRIKFYIRGLIAEKQGQNEEALEYFRQTLQILPPTWDLMDFEDSLGNGYLEQGKYDQSISEFQRILTINPNYPLAQYRLAQAYHKMGERDLAIESFKKFLEEWKDADQDIPEIKIARDQIEN